MRDRHTAREWARNLFTHEATSRIPWHKLQLFREPWLALRPRRCISHAARRETTPMAREGSCGSRIVDGPGLMVDYCERVWRGHASAKSISRAIDLRTRSLCNFTICLSRSIFAIDGNKEKKIVSNKCSTIKICIFCLKNKASFIMLTFSRQLIFYSNIHN